MRSGASRSGSETAAHSPTPMGKSAHAPFSDKTTLVNSPDDAGRLASAKPTGNPTGYPSSSSITPLPIKKNFQSSIDVSRGISKNMDFDDDDSNDSELESSICSASQMSTSNHSSNSGNPTRRLEHLIMKLDALQSSHQLLQYKAQS